MTSAAGNAVECRHCGMIHGAKCPYVKAIEYHPDGSIRRVEYAMPADYATPPRIPEQKPRGSGLEALPPFWSKYTDN